MANKYIGNSEFSNDIHINVHQWEGIMSFYQGIHGDFTTLEIELYRIEEDTHIQQNNWEYGEDEDHESEGDIEYDDEFEYVFLLSAYLETELIDVEAIDFDVTFRNFFEPISLRYGEDIETSTLIQAENSEDVYLYEIHMDIEHAEKELSFHYGIQGTFTSFDIELYSLEEEEYIKQGEWTYIENENHGDEYNIDYNLNYEYTFMISVNYNSEIIESSDINFYDIAIIDVPNTISLTYGDDIETAELIEKQEFRPSTDHMNVWGIVTGSLFIVVPLFAVMAYRYILKRKGDKNV